MNLSAVLPGWSAMANSIARTDAKIASGSDGGSAVAYLETGNGIDFALSTYETGLGQVDWIKYTYTATKAETGLLGSFDYESAWTRWVSSTTGGKGAGFGLTYAVNGGAAVSLGDAWHVTNANVTDTSDVTTWLTDARMDALGLSSRNVAFSLPGVTLNAGDTLTLAWTRGVYYNDRYMAQGIDNFKLGDNNSLAAPVPLPSAAWSGLALMGVLGLVTGVKRMRRQEA